jgi:hypothetical protein
LASSVIFAGDIPPTETKNGRRASVLSGFGVPGLGWTERFRTFFGKATNHLLPCSGDRSVKWPAAGIVDFPVKWTVQN